MIRLSERASKQPTYAEARKELLEEDTDFNTFNTESTLFKRSRRASKSGLEEDFDEKEFQEKLMKQRELQEHYTSSMVEYAR